MRHGAASGAAWGTWLLVISAPLLSAWGREDLVLPESLMGTRVAPLLLLSRPDVRADLELSTEQADSARQLLAELRVRALQIKGKGNNPDIVRQRRIIDEMQWNWLNTQLSIPQRDRLNQIDLQWEGAKALTRHTTVEALGLSREQLARIQEGLSRIAPPAGGSRRGSTPAQPAGETLTGVLTEDQEARWKVMLGRPFQVGQVAVKVDSSISRATSPNGR